MGRLRRSCSNYCLNIWIVWLFFLALHQKILKAWDQSGHCRITVAFQEKNNMKLFIMVLVPLKMYIYQNVMISLARLTPPTEGSV